MNQGPEAEKAADMFSDDKTWLQQQPGMNPWEDGCRDLTALLHKRLIDHSGEVCEEPVDPSDEQPAARYCGRLWGCLKHHWRDAIGVTPGGRKAVESVLQRLDECRGFRGGGRLGGNPLRDVVLAVAMTLGDEQAPRVFEKDYLPFARSLAGRMNYNLGKSCDEWWNDLLDHLAGYTGGSGRLDKFFGRCGLKNWLPPVVWNFLKGWLRRESKLKGGLDIADIGEMHSSKEDSGTVDESLRCFVEVVFEAVAALTKEDALLLQLLYVHKMKQKDVAGVLRIDPGNVTRRRRKVIERLRELIEGIGQKRLDPEAYESLLQHSIEDSRTFADALCDALDALGDALEEGREDKS